MKCGSRVVVAIATATGGVFWEGVGFRSRQRERERPKSNSFPAKNSRPVRQLHRAKADGIENIPKCLCNIDFAKNERAPNFGGLNQTLYTDRHALYAHTHVYTHTCTLYDEYTFYFYPADWLALLQLYNLLLGD